MCVHTWKYVTERKYRAREGDRETEIATERSSSEVKTRARTFIEEMNETVSNNIANLRPRNAS